MKHILSVTAWLVLGIVASVTVFVLFSLGYSSFAGQFRPEPVHMLLSGAIGFTAALLLVIAFRKRSSTRAAS